MIGRALRILILGWSVLAARPAGAQGFFGPEVPTAWLPEVDAYLHLSEGARLQAQVQPYLVPEQGISQVSLGLYGSLLVADVFRDLLSPDRTKSHVLDMRVGLLYLATLDAGTGAPGDYWTIQLEVTPRYALPWEVMASIRNRVSFNWGVNGASGFFFRLRERFQLEREFRIGEVAVTPYANVEMFWQQPPSMWSQFRIEGGLVVGFHAFARGQTIEVNYSAVTSLQPSRSWGPQIGLILSTYQ